MAAELRIIVLLYFGKARTLRKKPPTISALVSAYSMVTGSVSNFRSAHLSFSVVSANSANTSEAIQKRTMIFDSDQPSNSK